jgi:predicted secreted protein
MIFHCLRHARTAALLFVALPLQAQTVPHAVASADNLLTLSATASVDVTRDLLGLVFSTQREGADAAAVQSQLVQALEPALAEARRLARPGQMEVSTGNFSVFPRYAPKGGITQWQGTVELLVEGRDVETLTRLVPRITTLSVAGVGYSLSREARDKVQADVAAQAIARFRSQAEAYAKAFGFNAVTLRSVEVNNQDNAHSPMPVFRAARAGAAMAADEALPVEAGKASVSTTVSGTVQMK